MDSSSAQSTRWSTLARRFAVLLLLLVAACSKKDRSALVAGGVDVGEGSLPSTDSCATPGHKGCACSDAGAIVECGDVVRMSGDYVTCSMGYARCDGKTWGACEGNRVVAQSLPNRALGSNGYQLLSTTGGCANPCDPVCTAVTGTPTDLPSGKPLTVTDAGVSITPTTGTSGGTGPCKGLWCNVVSCGSKPATSISGIVYDPAGLNPLYNAYVYIPVDPTAALPAFTSGATCDTCAGTGNFAAVSVAQTGADGKFTLKNVPAGSNIPIVVQMGKWRRKTTIPSVTSCQDNAVGSTFTRLPRNRFDGDGNTADIPKMAIASGSADPFECLLLKAGIDASEIQLPSAGARIDYYVYNGVDRAPGGAPAGDTLTGNLTTLKQYDVVLLPCEGKEISARSTNAPNLVSYTSAGGRVFTTHFGYSWLATPLSGVARNQTQFYGTADWSKLNQSDYNDPTTGTIDQSFPKGQAFAAWLKNVGASTTLGQITLNEPRHDAIKALNPPSQSWVTGFSKLNTTKTPDMLLSMTFNMPTNVAADKQCGRVVYSDFHVSADALVSSSSTCTANTDCGYGATCNAPVVGKCSTETCYGSSDCSDSSYSCNGGTYGTCVASGSCTSDSQCSSDMKCSGSPKKCVPRSCSRNSDCGWWGSCKSGTCQASACGTNSDCGSAQSCSGAAVGTCKKTCTKDSDCASWWYNTTCVSGQCQGCLTANDCPGSSTTCVGGSAGGCSSTSSYFPLTCRNGTLSAQEKALEFMLFDLTACVSPDSWTPPAPSTVYNPVTFTLDFSATCSGVLKPVWRELDWQASIPTGASIDFSGQTASTVAGLASAQSVKLGSATTSTALPAWDVAVIETSTDGAFRTANPRIASASQFRLTVTLNPTSDQKASPTLSQWKVQYDCVDTE
ncbi:MAG TPA: hypothetical protein VFQ35_26090 [Polyangiaceae bacterium]|nr:hypothetical protein [Polyangiaceae bacterium]